MHKLSGLYAITDSTLIPDAQLAQAVSQAIAGGARLIQYRDKSTDHARRRRQAHSLLQVCGQQAALLIINDDVALAAAVDAHGVHIGKDDAGLADARARLGDNAIIGVSCYNRQEDARQAQAGGADYVAFGSFFPSPTKPAALRADLALLRAARPALSIPIAAIGGITPDNGAELVAAGADMLAVIHGVFGQADIQDAAAAYQGFFSSESSRRWL